MNYVIAVLLCSLKEELNFYLTDEKNCKEVKTLMKDFRLKLQFRLEFTYAKSL